MPDFIVPYTAFALKNVNIKQDLMKAFESVLDSGRYVMGPECAAFEREFADYCQAKHAAGMSNGTCALHIALREVGLEPGDEVISVPNSFIATAASIAIAGGRPVFVDARLDLNIDPAQIEAAITPRTRAIVPVHLAGRPARMPEILAIAKKHNLFVLEDAAQAVGAKILNKRVGSWGDAACFSLHPLKNLHAFGDGGMMTSNTLNFCERVAKRRNHGLKNREQCDSWGFNCRLDEVQAALLRVQLRQLDQWTEERRKLAFRYNELLSPFVEVPLEGPDEYHVYQTFVVQCDQRDELKAFLLANGVEVLVHYPTPIHLQPAAGELGYDSSNFPVTHRICARILSLPLYPGLTEQQQDIVVDLIKNFYEGK